MQQPKRGRLPVDVPQAYRIQPSRRAPAQIPAYAPDMRYREEPSRDDTEDDTYVIELN